MTPRSGCPALVVLIATVGLLSSCGDAASGEPGKDTSAVHPDSLSVSHDDDHARPAPHEGEPGPESKLTLPKEKWIDPRASGG